MLLVVGLRLLVEFGQSLNQGQSSYEKTNKNQHDAEDSAHFF